MVSHPILASETLKERVSQIEEVLGEWSNDDGTVSMWVASVMNELQVQRDLAKSNGKYLEEKVDGMKTEFQSKINNFR